MVKVIFYKGKGNWFDKLIRWWTNSNYSHCEIVVDEVCYSSSPRDGGVRAKRIDYYTNNWEIIEVYTTQAQKKLIKQLFKKEEGKKYDVLGILLTQVVPIGIQATNRWFCSEICSAVLMKAGVDLNNRPQYYSPESLFRELLVKKSNTIHIKLL